MESQSDYQTLKAMLDWQVELGATEAICNEPVNRFEIPEVMHSSEISSKPVPRADGIAASAIQEVMPVPEMAAPLDVVAIAKELAANAADLPQLLAALESFEHCEIKRGAKNTVFSDGDPKARLMIIGEAPGRDEDIQGRPFVGRAGQLLDRMLEAIDFSRDASLPASTVYITNILPWRPPQNRDPLPDEISMMLPFVERHIELVKPDVLVLMGNISCLAMLGQKGITRLRGNWKSALNIPTMPMFHPAYLLRNPAAKREAWQDLLMLQALLRTPK